MLKITPYLALDEQTKQIIDYANDINITLTFSESAVFAALLAEPSVIVCKTRLLALGWPDRVVAPTSLTQCISTLRKKLEPYSELQLKTIARRGYQLHISEQSQIKMVSLSDTNAIKDVLVGVSKKTKLIGVFLGLAIGLIIWYVSDFHSVLKNSAHWVSDKTIALNIGGVPGEANLIYRSGVEKLHPSWWQKHIAPETNWVHGMKDFSAFALADGKHYSMSICNGVNYQDCNGENIINIAAIDEKPAGLDIQQFLPLTEKLENRIRYNRISLPSSERPDSSLMEYNYQADVYFPIAGELLVRSDITMSLIYETEDTGVFYFASCVTDQDCQTTPIKYQMRGDFTLYHSQIGDFYADVFHVKVKQKSLNYPENISDSAVRFFKENRRHDILDDELFFYRLYQNDKSAVWIIPRMGNLIMWANYQKIAL